MKIKRIVKINFSPTENTKKICNSIASAFDLPEVDFDRTSFDSRWKNINLEEDDLAIIGVPVYFGRTPAIMDEFFRYIEAKNTPAIVFVTYGNREYEDSLLELTNLSTEKNFKVVSAGAFIGEHSYSKKIATNRPNENDLSVAKEFGEATKKMLEEKNSIDDLKIEVKGNFPYKAFQESMLVPNTNEKCNKCMLCEKECPLKAISPDNPSEIDRFRCILCTKCTHICPQNAKEINNPIFKEKVEILEMMLTNPKEPETFFAK